MALVTERQLARALGVSQQAVNKALQAGRITPPVKVGNEVKLKFNLETAMAEYTETSSGRYATNEGTGTDTQNEGAPEAPPTRVVSNDYYNARAKKEAALAIKAELQAAILSGSLIEFKDAQKIAREAGRVFRSNIENIPERLAGRLASESNADTVHDILTAELETALNALADILETAAWAKL